MVILQVFFLSCKKRALLISIVWMSTGPQKWLFAALRISMEFPLIRGEWIMTFFLWWTILLSLPLTNALGNSWENLQPMGKAGKPEVPV